MKNFLISKKLINTIYLVVLVFSASAQHKMVDDRPSNKGELLKFKLSYGWFTIGKASMKTHQNMRWIGGDECYKIDIFGKTAGLIGAFSKVNDRWGAIIRKDDYLPHYSYRDLEEGSYRKNEKVYFDYESMKIRVEDYDVKADEPKPTIYFDLEKNNVYDLIGGLMYARSLNYGEMVIGDTLRINAYFDKTFYDFSMVFRGKERISTKVGKIECYKVMPMMPDNKLFRGKNPVTFWISSDVNRIPLKVEADMFFGTAYCELTSYKNVKMGIDYD